MAYPLAEMAFCSHCGKLAQGGRFCAACGAAVAPGAAAAMAAEARRQRTEMRLIAAVLGLVFIVSAGLVVSHSRQSGRGGESAVPAQQQLPSSPVTDTRALAQAVTDAAPSSQPQYPQAPADGSSGLERDPGSQPAKVENANDSPAPQQVPPGFVTDAQVPPGASIPALLPGSQQHSQSPAGIPPGSDRYPGSEPIKVENANLPDVGIPVATAVYTTSDSVSAVISYYTQRYPDAEVTEVNGQNIVAVNRPGATKVIAIGSSGSETRIAIVQPDVP